MSLFDFFKKKKTKAQANINASNSKEDIMRMIFQNMTQKTPSEHFVSGAVFDIARQNHDDFASIVNSGNAIALREFFAKAYIRFCNQPEIVGFSQAMVDVGRNDTNPAAWNADIVNMPSGEKAALCFMPVNSEAHAARIIGIVLGNGGDKYYYCMLNKDENVLSDVMQNKAMLGVEKVGSVKGLGFELMNSFVECINNNR